MEIKRSLQKYEVKYALLYPARLRVEAMGEVLFFDSPTGATRWLEGNKQTETEIQGEEARELRYPS